MATRRWLGAAADVYDLWTISVGGTWLAGETFTITINNKSLVVTVGTTVTVAQVALLAKYAFNSLLSSLGAGESYAPTGGGQSIPEFKEYTATSTSTTVVLTANTAGRSGTISVVEASTSGTFTIAQTTAATGKNFFNNQDNWSANTAPVNGDTIVFDSGSTDCTEALTTGLTGLTIKVLSGYRGKIGLPEVNGTGTSAYDEYRTKSLTTAGGTTTVLVDNENLQRCRIAVGANPLVASVLATGSRIDSDVPVVLLTGGDSTSTLAIAKGDVAAAFYAGETAQFLTLDMSFLTNQASDANFIGGAGLTLDTCNKLGGIAEFNAAVETFTQYPQGGQTTFWGAGAVDEFACNGGLVNWNSTGTLGTTSSRVGFDGHLNFDQDGQAKAIAANIEVYGPNAKLTDSRNAVTLLAYEMREGARPENVKLGPNLIHQTLPV